MEEKLGAEGEAPLNRELSQEAHRRRLEMETAGYWYLILHYGLPAVLSTLAVSFYSIVDRIFLGRVVGAEGLAATALVFPIILCVDGLGALFSVGGLSVFSRAYGGGRIDEARNLFCSIHTLVTLLMVFLLSLLWVGACPVLRFTGGTDSTLPAAMVYLRILCLGMFFSFLSSVMMSLLRCIGQPRWALFSILGGEVLNVALDWLFMVHWGWGVAGAAWATAFGMSFAFSLAWWGLWRRYCPFTALRRGDFVPRLKDLVEMVLVGLSPFLSILSFGVLTVVFNKLAGALHDAPGLASVSVFFALDSFLYMPVMGMWNGIVALVGYCYGAGLYGRVRGITNRAIGLGTAVLLINWAIVLFAAPALVSLFVSPGDPSYGLSVRALYFGYACMWVGGLTNAGTFVFDALGRYKAALALTLAPMAVVFAGGYLLVGRFGWDGLWSSVALMDLSRGLLCLALMLPLYARLRREEGHALARESHR